jgi:hypothetical protein
MSMPSQAILQAGLTQLNAKWMNRAGINRVVLQTDPSGKIPAYYFQGSTTAIPSSIPSCMMVPDTDGKPYSVPVFWRRDVGTPIEETTAALVPEIFNQKGDKPLDPFVPEDVDKAYWFFATPPTLDRSVKNYLPAFHAIPQPTNMAPPPADQIDTQYHIDMRLPQYDNPNYWSLPFEPSACICCAWFNRPTLVYSFVVPDTFMLVLKGISYDIMTVFPFGTVFQVDIRRGGSLVATFEEIVVDPTNVDPSKRCAFSSHESPTPLFIIIDRGEQLTVEITVKGPYPFTKTLLESFCGTICIMLQGWLASIMDNRDGAMRPSDVGEMREGRGDETYTEITDNYVQTLLAWVAAVTGSK